MEVKRRIPNTSRFAHDHLSVNKLKIARARLLLLLLLVYFFRKHLKLMMYTINRLRYHGLFSRRSQQVSPQKVCNLKRIHLHTHLSDYCMRGDYGDICFSFLSINWSWPSPHLFLRLGIKSVAEYWLSHLSQIDRQAPNSNIVISSWERRTNERAPWSTHSVETAILKRGTYLAGIVFWICYFLP